MAKKKTAKETESFEDKLGRLEQLVDEMEGGGLPLEESLKKFEEGVALVRECEAVLKGAQLRVEKLTEKDGELERDKFEG